MNKKDLHTVVTAISSKDLATVSTTLQKYTPAKVQKHSELLFRAVEENNLPVLNLLLQNYEFPPDVTTEIDDGNDPCIVTALCVAVELGHVDIVEALLDAGADPNNDDANAPVLLFACQYKLHKSMLRSTNFREDIAQLLVNRGARYEDTCVRPYCQKIHLYNEAIPFLHAHNLWKFEELKGADKYEDETDPIVAAIVDLHSLLNPTSGSIEEEVLATLREVLVKFQDTIDDVDIDHGYTPLMLAAELGWVAAMELLVECGADLNASNDEGLTALHIAAQKDQGLAISCLLEKGVDIDSFGAHKTPLMWAAFYGRANALKVLLENGANQFLSDEDEVGHTALMDAASYTNLEVVQLLVDAAGDRKDELLLIKDENNDNKIALDYATEYFGSSHELTKYLQNVTNVAADQPSSSKRAKHN